MTPPAHQWINATASSPARPALAGRGGARSNGHMTDTTIDTDEIAKFSAMADDWWDPTGKFKPLHKFNPVRLTYIRDWALKQFSRSEKARHPLEGLTVLDIGCGGGLLTEP